MLTEECTDTVESVLARSALYSVVAATFRHPDNPLFRACSSQEEYDAILEAVACCGAQKLAPIESALRHLHQSAGTVEQEELIKAFVFLFGHISRGRVPPYETEYGTGGPFFQPQEMSDIFGFYHAFGLDLDTTKHERMDHLCCECEFLCFLCAKQAYALEANDLDTAAECDRVQRLFLRDHFVSFAHTFFIRVKQQPEAPWHAAAATFAAAFLDSECERFDLVADRTYLPLRSNEEVEVPMACGSCKVPCSGAESPED